MRTRLSGAIRGPLVGALHPICICSLRLRCVCPDVSTRSAAGSERRAVARSGPATTTGTSPVACGEVGLTPGGSTMDFGIHIGTRGCLTTRDNIMAVAQQAEALGYTHLGVADHLIVPVQTGVRYPYTADGVWPGAPTGECFDCIATLAVLAGCTQNLKLLTSVAVVPHRPAVLAAKLFMTADVLSGGRVIAGVGTGWMREEFEALGTPPYDERGAVTDEY